jgi:hypothetical protein
LGEVLLQYIRALADFSAYAKKKQQPKHHKKWRIYKSIIFRAIGPNLATFSPTMGATGQSTDLVNLKGFTMFCRTVLTSSSGLRIKGCVSCWKEDSKSYTLGTKTHKYGHGLIFYPKNSHTRRYLKVIFYSHLNEKFSTASL